MSAELVIADLTGRNPNVFYELAIRHCFKKPVIQIKDDTDLDPIPFDILGMRMISVDYRYLKKMEKCKEEIIKQIKTLENDPFSIDSPISFIEKSRSMEKLYEEITNIRKKIDKLEKQEPGELEHIKELKHEHDNKIKELSSQLPTTADSKEIISKNKTSPTNRPKILWVDDNPINNEGIINIYNKEADFDLAINTSQALNNLSKNKYDLIISDMGRGSSRDEGIKMIKAIKESIPNPPPIYILCSRRAKENYGQKALEEGAVLVTSSPIELIYHIMKNKHASLSTFNNLA
jgi:PleD family two-component response regulator